MYPSAPSTSDPGAPRPRRPWATLTATAVLTVGAVALGQRDRALPERVQGGFQVAALPASLVALVLGLTAAGLLVGGWAVLREGAVRPRDAVFLAWLVVSLLAAAALTWNAFLLATLAASEPGPIIPVFHWMFTFVPAVLVGLAARRRGGTTASTAALATAAVSLPLLGLGWSLLASREPALTGFGTSLWNTAFFGVLPLVIALAIVASSSRGGRDQFV
jgi:hypothetical protein